MNKDLWEYGVSNVPLLFPAHVKSGFHIKSVSTIVSEFPAQPSEEFNHSSIVHAPQLLMVNIWSDSE